MFDSCSMISISSDEATGSSGCAFQGWFSTSAGPCGERGGRDFLHQSAAVISQIRSR